MRYHEGVMAALKSGATVTSFALHKLEPEFERGELRFEGLTLPRDSFEVRAFLDDPHANAKTPTEGNPHYLGTQSFYGLGPQAEAFAPGARERGEGQFAPMVIRLNVTDRLRAFVARADKKDVPVTLVAVDGDGNEIADPGLNFEGLSLVTS
jgi:tyrosinase